MRLLLDEFAFHGIFFIKMLIKSQKMLLTQYIRRTQYTLHTDIFRVSTIYRMLLCSYQRNEISLMECRGKLQFFFIFFAIEPIVHIVKLAAQILPTVHFAIAAYIL